MIKILLAYSMIVGSGVSDARLYRQDWSVISKTYKGNISVVRNLSLRDAAKVADFAENTKWRTEYYIGRLYPNMPVRPRLGISSVNSLNSNRSLLNFGSACNLRILGDNDIIEVEVVGPGGWQSNCYFSWRCR